MHIIGLTGGIGAGKSTVARLLTAHGTEVIDVDGIGRSVIAPGGRAVEAVVARFGPTVLGADGGVDRAALAQIVFSDPTELAALEDISHPAINAELDERLAALPDDRIVVLDMAVLVGSRLGRDLPSGLGYTTVVVVETDLDTRIRRLVDQRGMSETDARARIAAQPSDEERRAVADFVIHNDGDEQALAAEVDTLAHRLGLPDR